MPLVEGESLRDLLRREGQLPVDETISLIQKVASALDYAHRKGVLHRDIKPENILLQDHQPLLADFGIALAVSAAGGDRLTRTGLSIGTPSYMSPEQTAGERALDARSDIYALGCVAYEALAGDPPFTGPTYQAVVAAVMTGEPKPVTELRPSVPDAPAHAIHRALERLPADRFATAAEFAAALSTGPEARVSRRRPKSRTAIWVALGVAAGIVIGVLAPRTQSSRHHARKPALEHRPSGQRTGRRRRTRLGSGPADGDRPLAGRGPPRVRRPPRQHHGPDDPPAGQRLGGGDPGNGWRVSSVLLADGAWIGFFSGNVLRKVSATGGNPVTLVEVDRTTGASWASADRILVFENEGFDLRWISASGATADSTIHLATQFGNPDILAGGQWAVGQLSSGQLALLSLRDGNEFAITRRGVLPLDSVAPTDLLFGTSPRWVQWGISSTAPETACSPRCLSTGRAAGCWASRCR